MPFHVEPLPPGSKLLRAYPPGVDPDEAHAAMESFVGVCVVTLVGGVARIVGALSRWQHPVRRQDIEAMIAIARGMGARELRIKRADGHVMPRPFRLVGDEWVLNL